MTIDQCLVTRILVDINSSVNVLFKDTFKQMDISWSKVLPYEAPLVGFTRQIMKPNGKITLPVSIGDIAHMVKFLIVVAPSPYNCIMGRPALIQLQARSMKVPIMEEVQMIYTDLKGCL